MRIIFLGTPEFAVPSLQALLDRPDLKVVGLVTQPDRPAGRGKQLMAPPTKILAQKHEIPVLQPERLSKAPDVVQAMQDLKADILVTVAFGQILKKNVLEMAPHGVMNVHGSLLPKYRGAAPINWAIINGESKTGVTTMYSDPGVDTGKMLLKREMEIRPDMDAETLAEEMSHVGAELLLETLKALMAGNLEAIAQNDAEATMAPRLTKEMGNIDWHKSALEIHNLVRGLTSWPGTYTHLDGAPVKVMKTSPASSQGKSSAEAGTVLSSSPKFIVACGNNDAIEILEVKPANKAKMAAASWANGLHLKAGSILRMQ
ncbi:MAG: methionyl-tRNA formyltransferase [Candidatus Obscuribacterales bacterium]|nr:methionyl-tRNA formyltransferase [Candidatus Obscuribacterales bacterium]